MATQEAAWDPDKFEKSWIACTEKIIQDIMSDEDIQKIKNEVRTKGHVTDEHKDQFITKVNEIKNKFIEQTYGKPGSDAYKGFVHSWEHWLKLKGKNRPQGENMFEDNMNHLLYGSTPNPDLFLRDFDIYRDIK